MNLRPVWINLFCNRYLQGVVWISIEYRMACFILRDRYRMLLHSYIWLCCMLLCHVQVFRIYPWRAKTFGMRSHLFNRLTSLYTHQKLRSSARGIRFTVVTILPPRSYRQHRQFIEWFIDSSNLRFVYSKVPAHGGCLCFPTRLHVSELIGCRSMLILQHASVCKM